MTPAFTARRRAEEFDALVEALSTGSLRDADHDAQHSRDTRYADLLEVVGALRAAPPPTPRPEFVADLRSRLMTEAQTALVAPSEPTPVRTPARTRSRERRLAAVIGGFAVVSATGSMAVAAQSALPGDTLYPLKRGIENAQVKVQSGDDDKGAALLENAAGRLDEVGELTRDGDGRAADISATLDDFSAQSTEASELLLDDYADTGRVVVAGGAAGVHGRQPRGTRAPGRPGAARGPRRARRGRPDHHDHRPAGGQRLPGLHRPPGGGVPAARRRGVAARRDRQLRGRSGPHLPIRRRQGQGQGRSGGTDGPADPTASPAPPSSGQTTPPAPSQPSLPTDGATQPPTTGGGENPIDPIVPDLPDDGTTGSGGPKSGDPLGDLVEDTTESLNDLLGG